MPQFEFTTESWILLGILVVTALVALTLLVYVVRQARAGGARAAAGADAADEPEPAPTLAPGETARLSELLAGGRDPEPYLMRFVDDAKGERAGETITVHEGQVVLKSGEKFLAVPTEQIIVEGEDLRTSEDVDWDAAARDGEAWRSAGERRLAFDESGEPVQE